MRHSHPHALSLPLLAAFALAVLGCPGPEPPTQKTCDPPCGELQQCVDGFCRDVTCNPPCRQGRVCVNGFCLRACDPESEEQTCGLSETCCPDVKACVDTHSDFYNCGGCGEPCPAVLSNVCADSRCGCSGFTVNPCGEESEGWGCCEDGCKDLTSDPDNCGTCGHDCDELQCVEGECRCSTDEPCTTGEECCEDGCRDTKTDALNCGRCGYACEEGQECCNGECANTLADPAHCGDCGLPCADGEECCIGTCSNTQTDPFNCGECLKDCGLGGSCTAGECS